MEILGELLFELILRRIIVGIFGFYSLMLFFKISGNTKKIEWLNETVACRGEEFGKGILISVVGLIVFSTLFISIIAVL